MFRILHYLDILHPFYIVSKVTLKWQPLEIGQDSYKMDRFLFIGCVFIFSITLYSAGKIILVLQFEYY